MPLAGLVYLHYKRNHMTLHQEKKPEWFGPVIYDCSSLIQFKKKLLWYLYLAWTMTTYKLYASFIYLLCITKIQSYILQHQSFSWTTAIFDLYLPLWKSSASSSFCLLSYHVRVRLQWSHNIDILSPCLPQSRDHWKMNIIKARVQENVLRLKNARLRFSFCAHMLS